MWLRITKRSSPIITKQWRFSSTSAQCLTEKMQYLMSQSCPDPPPPPSSPRAGYSHDHLSGRFLKDTQILLLHLIILLIFLALISSMEGRNEEMCGEKDRLKRILLGYILQQR
ncbi:hypothetical protein E2C01_077219 [Portunus trituberculatus]|uniref:Uncharacterized protein n=1 Tax=Portunus trituberculatus TaxID=210409 RepID=A0A5B7ILL0_PORTR|nr:hypothetical protein [Portunus trituberculatus]